MARPSLDDEFTAANDRSSCSSVSLVELVVVISDLGSGTGEFGGDEVGSSCGDDIC